MTARFLVSLGTMLPALLATTTPPPLTQQDHIRINLQALIMSIIFVAALVVLIYLLNKRAGKRRYAAHQARLAAEGRLDRTDALSEIANSGPNKPRFINDDAAAPAPNDRRIGSVFGENYRPYGNDAT